MIFLAYLEISRQYNTIKYRLGSPGAPAENQSFGSALAKTLSEKFDFAPALGVKNCTHEVIP
jgi:hypothetical protein